MTRAKSPTRVTAKEEITLAVWGRPRWVKAKQEKKNAEETTTRNPGMKGGKLELWSLSGARKDHGLKNLELLKGCGLEKVKGISQGEMCPLFEKGSQKGNTRFLGGKKKEFPNKKKRMIQTKQR